MTRAEANDNLAGANGQRAAHPAAAASAAVRVAPLPAGSERVWLLLGFSVLLGLMLLQTVLSLRQIDQQRQQLESVIEIGLTKFDLVGRMHAAGRERLLLLQRMFLTADPFEREALRESFSHQAELFIHARQRLLAMPLDTTEQRLMQEQSVLSQRFHQLHLQVLDLLDRGEVTQATRLFSAQLLPTQYAVLERISRLFETQQRNARAIWLRSDRLQQEAKRLLLVVAALVLLLGALVAYFVLRRVHLAATERERLASYDSLTGLPNRLLIYNMLDQALARAQRHGMRLALMFIDLDRFKAINDTLGHHAGDALLCEVAARLKDSVRTTDSVGRLAGDEFIVLLEDLQHVDEATAVAAKVLDALRSPVSIGGERVQVGASIGIALYPDHGRDRQTLLGHADAAMYAVKGGGRSAYRLHGDDRAGQAGERPSAEP